MSEISELIEQADGGSRQARDRLFSAAYGELRRLAMSRLYRGGRSATLGTTALVHESYLRITKSASLHCRDRAAFFLYAARVMRAVIVDAVRQRGADKRGAGASCVTLDTGIQHAVGAAPLGDVVRVHESLEILEQVDAVLVRVVEMRYFGGYSDAEIAQALDVTDRTVRRYWRKARQLLRPMLL